MSIEVYVVDGTTYNVSPDQKENFLSKFGKDLKPSHVIKDGVSVDMSTGETQKINEPIELFNSKIDSNIKENRIQQTSPSDLSKKTEIPESIKKAEDLVLKYKPTDDQVIEADQKSQDYIDNILAWTTKDEKKSTGYIPGQAKFEDNVTLQKELDIAEHNVSVRNAIKEWNDLSNDAKRNLLKSYNLIEGNEKINQYDENNVKTPEYEKWLETIPVEDIIAETRRIKSNEFQGEYIKKNIERSYEESREKEINELSLALQQPPLVTGSFLGKSNEQKQEEAIMEAAAKDINSYTLDLVEKRNTILTGVNNLTNEFSIYEKLGDELKPIEDEIKKLESIEGVMSQANRYPDFIKKPTTKSYNKVIKDHGDLINEHSKLIKNYTNKGGRTYEELMKDRASLLKASELIDIEFSEATSSINDINQVLDLTGRYYGWQQNVAMGISSSIASTTGSYIDLVKNLHPYKIMENLYVKDGKKVPMPDWARTVARVSQVAASPKFGMLDGETTVAVLDKTADRIWSWDNALHKNMQLPKTIDEIEDISDFGEWGAYQATTNASTIAMAMSGGVYALPALGAMTVGREFRDREDEEDYYSNLPENHPLHNFKYSFAQRYGAASLMGFFEFVTEIPTVAQIKYFKNLLNQPGAKRGFGDFIKRNFFTQRGAYVNYYMPIEEGGTEGMAAFTQNATQILVKGKDISYWDGVNDNMASGAFISKFIFQAPSIGRNVIRAFQPTDAKIELEGISMDIHETMKTLNDGNFVLSEQTKFDLQKRVTNLVDKHTQILNETINNIDKLTPAQKNILINADVEIASLKSSNKNLENETSLSLKDIKNLQSKNNSEIARWNAIKNQTLAKANASNNFSQIQRSTVSAQKDANRIFGPSVEFIQVNKNNINDAVKNFISQEIAAINKKIKSKKAKGEDISSLIRDRRDARSLTVDDVANSHGIESNHGNTILINTEFAASRGATNVANHEFFHRVLKATLADNPAAAVALGNAIDSYLMKIDPEQVEQSEMANRITAYKDLPEAMRAEEKLTLFLDALKTGDIKIGRTGNQVLKGAFRRILQSTGLKDVQLNTAEDVFNFINDFKASRNSIFFNKAFAKGARKGFKIGDKLIEKYGKNSTKASKAIKKSQDAGDYTTSNDIINDAP